MTGFRLSKGGASEYYGVIPDMVTLGKIIGGGLPVGAFGGKKEIMDMVALLAPFIRLEHLVVIPLQWAVAIHYLKSLTKIQIFILD